MSWRGIRDKARRVVHDTMRVPALYLVEIGEGPIYADPVPINVRVHLSDKALGDLKGTNFHYAERVEPTPQIVFLTAEVQPERGAVVSVAAGEAYRVDHVLPRDGGFVTAEVTAMSAAETADLPVPESA